jgi:hypothetical protein
MSVFFIVTLSKYIILQTIKPILGSSSLYGFLFLLRYWLFDWLVDEALTKWLFKKKYGGLSDL